MDDELKIVCLERLYKVSKSEHIWYIKAKRELIKDIPRMISQEDSEIKLFLEDFDLVNVDIPGVFIRENIDKLLENNIPKNIHKNKKWLTFEERLGIINQLPEWFGTSDFVKVLNDIGYSKSDGRRMWKSTWRELSENNMIEKTGVTSTKKYRIIQKQEVA